MFKKVPQYRLQGYTDAWELRKLNEVSDIYDGTHQTPKYQDDGVMFLSVENIKTLTSNKFISREAFEVEFKIRPQRGDVLMTRIGDIGTANVVETDEDLAYYVSLALFKSEELNPYFLQASIYAPFVQDQIWKRTLHIAFPKKINKNEIGHVPINVPTLAEQTKIGSFFKQLDNTITLHQRKLDMLKEQKKTYLKLLFPAKGQTKPVLRFQGFEDDWEKVKLGEIGETFTGLSGKTKEDFGHGEGKFITYVNVFNNPISDLLGTDRIEVDESQTNVQFGDIFFTTSSETPEEVGMSSVWLGNGNNIYLNSFCFGFRPTLKLSNHFMAYVLRSTEIRKKFIFLAQGISRYNISKTKVMNISIPLPTLPEQESIGTFFQTLDQEIAQVEDKLASLKEMKKTLLRKLFV